jgi:crossover junction endodeoxyribonuclease RuvC
MIFIGIDPGKSGALVALRDDGSISSFIKGDETEHDIAFWLRASAAGGNGVVATLERVGAMPGQGVSSTFKFGQSFGFLKGILTALAIPYCEVGPVKWQNAMSCRTGGDKNVSKSAAQRLWPDKKITHAIADALLIAEYGRRTHK